MKKFFIFNFLLLFFVSFQSSAQLLLQASIGMGSTSSRVKIYVKSNTTFTPTNLSNLQFNVGVADNDVIPTPTVISSANGISWTITPHTEGGYHNFQITASVFPIKLNLTKDVEFEMMELEFPAHTILNDEVSLVTLPDGGSDAFSMFLATGVPNSDGSNLYYTRSGTVVDNEFSYDLSGSTPGTTTSTATISLTTLPVQLSGFVVNSKNNYSFLSWVVENQDASSSHFEIERSYDGNAFHQIARVETTSAHQASYSYTDKNVTLSGPVYYRLKMVDKDDHYSYSEIKTVQLNVTGFAVNLYPNPVLSTSKLSVNLQNPALITVIVNDAMGRQIKQIQFYGLKGVNESPLDLTSANPGAYLIKVLAGSDSQTISIIKK
ncbi:MAG: T9SS type A sorting domain-containing protein [Ginsengibacter sp.]